MSRFVIAAISLCAALTGCPATVPVRQSQSVNVPFSVQEHRGYMQTGSSTVKGQAFLRQQGGGVVTCAGKQVLLSPATPFYREVYRIARSGANPILPPPPPELSGKQISKVSQCDAQGNFAFDGIPAGRWMVATEVLWSVGYNAQGGGLLREFDVPSAGTVTVLLTDTDRI